jgi:hypothetical protein
LPRTISGGLVTQATFTAERTGVSAASLEFSKWGWAFREQPIADFGIDAHVEPVTNGRPLGRQLALQVKSGHSYFENPAEDGWVFRDSDKHLLYWLRHPLPVILLLHDPDSGVTYWAHVTQAAAEFTGSGWKMLVPSSQVLGPDAAGMLRALAESAPGACDDPIETSCERLLPSAAATLRQAQETEPEGTMRLATLLAKGRAAPRLAVESVLSGSPSWLPKGKGSSRSRWRPTLASTPTRTWPVRHSPAPLPTTGSPGTGCWVTPRWRPLMPAISAGRGNCWPRLSPVPGCRCCSQRSTR